MNEKAADTYTLLENKSWNSTSKQGYKHNKDHDSVLYVEKKERERKEPNIEINYVKLVKIQSLFFVCIYV